MKEDTLNNLKLGEQAKIKALNCTGNLRRRLLDLGFIANTNITAMLRSVSKGLTAYRVCGSFIALRDEDAAKIIILIHEDGLNNAINKGL